MVVLALSLPSATTTEVGILPVGGTSVSLDMVPMLEALDAALRKKAVDGFHYQASTVTRGQVSGARAMGISCGLEDAPCLAKLAGLAEVDLVVSPIATPVGADFSLKLFVVNRAGEAVSAEALVPSGEGRDAALFALAEKALSQAKVVSATPPTPPPDEPAPAPQPEPQPQAQPAAEAEAGGPSLLFAGGAVAATGGAVALGTGIAALVLEAQLASPEAYADRVPKMTAGRALVAVCAVSSVVAVGGGALVGIALATE